MEPRIIETIIKSSELLKDSKLNFDIFSENESICQLNSYFQTNSVETMILVTIFQLSAEAKRINREDMAKFLDCNPIQFFKFEENFNSLIKRKFLENTTRFSRKQEYQISDILHDSILQNNRPDMSGHDKKTDPIEILTELVCAIDERENNDGNTLLLVILFNTYLKEYQDIPFFTALDKLNLPITDKLVWLLMIDRNLNGTSTMHVDTVGDLVFSKASDKINFYNQLHDKTNLLIADNWIEFVEGGFINSACVQLTSKSTAYLKPLGILLRLDETKNSKQLLAAEKIVRKKLYFNSAEGEQLLCVTKSLKYRNHINIQKRLKKQGLRTGICTLLYGSPGTGKTESVYQIAKETGRALWKVDLSELKSMWYGESQKKVKALFTDYAALCKDETRTPILLLNEADAILGKRNSNAGSGSESANNAIQNIFLDCLEDFEGILFATTNLEKSLDTAFERRFLFKIKFERPENIAQQQIWKSMVKALSTAQSKTLSETYNLSGGEIENVLRKLSMMQILEDEIPIFETIKKLCENEQLGLKEKGVPIGYFR